MIVDLMPDSDAVHALDLERLQAVKEAWAVKAAAFFRRNAANWSRIRALHADQEEIDRALAAAFAEEPAQDLLDIGTGDGHVLRLLGDQVDSAVGVDRSRDMLNVARANIFRVGLRNCQVRQADMAQLPFPAASFDVVTLHMVLHYADVPSQTIAEAARVLRPGGRLLVVDFAPHQRAELREEFAHRWLGFSDATLATLFAEAGLVGEAPERLEGGPITVCLWSARSAANDDSNPKDAVEAG